MTIKSPGIGGTRRSWRSLKQKLGLRSRQWKNSLFGVNRTQTLGVNSAYSYGSIYGRTGSIVGRY